MGVTFVSFSRRRSRAAENPQLRSGEAGPGCADGAVGFPAVGRGKAGSLQLHAPGLGRYSRAPDRDARLPRATAIVAEVERGGGRHRGVAGELANAREAPCISAAASGVLIIIALESWGGGGRLYDSSRRSDRRPPRSQDRSSTALAQASVQVGMANRARRLMRVAAHGPLKLASGRGANQSDPAVGGVVACYAPLEKVSLRHRESP